MVEGWSVVGVLVGWRCWLQNSSGGIVLKIYGDCGNGRRK